MQQPSEGLPRRKYHLSGSGHLLDVVNHPVPGQKGHRRGMLACFLFPRQNIHLFLFSGFTIFSCSVFKQTMTILASASSTWTCLTSVEGTLHPVSFVYEVLGSDLQASWSDVVRDARI